MPFRGLRNSQTFVSNSWHIIKASSLKIHVRLWHFGAHMCWKRFKNDATLKRIACTRIQTLDGKVSYSNNDNYLCCTKQPMCHIEAIGLACWWLSLSSMCDSPASLSLCQASIHPSLFSRFLSLHLFWDPLRCRLATPKAL